MRKALTIYKKEISEMVRDRRVIVGVFVMPAIVLVLMFQMFGMIGNSIKKNISKTSIAILKPEKDNRISQALEAASKEVQSGDKAKAEDEFRPKIVFVDQLEKGRKMVEDGKVRYMMAFPSDFEQGLLKGTATIETYYDSGQETSEIAVKGLERWIWNQNQDSLKKTLEGAHIPPTAMEPIKLVRKDVAKENALSGSMLVTMLPYLLILFAFIGGMSVVSDLVAGEKERGTMETLLISPASRREIALGKFLALATISVLSVVSIITGFLISSATGGKSNEMMFGSGSAGGIQIGAILTIAAVLLPLVLAFSGIMLAISAYAKNMREAQTYLGIANFVVVTPAVFSQMIGFTDLSQSVWVKLTPVLNTALTIRNVLLGKPDASLLGLTILSSLLLASIGFALALRMFENEKILVRV